MFLAPLSVPPSLSASSRSRPRRSRLRANAVLAAWLVAGCAVVLFVPAARGGRLLGGTLPFWLVAAPLVDLAWVGRARLAANARALVSRLRSRPAPRNVRHRRQVRAAISS
jgi:hypothetical protein